MNANGSFELEMNSFQTQSFPSGSSLQLLLVNKMGLKCCLNQPLYQEWIGCENEGFPRRWWYMLVPRNRDISSRFPETVRYRRGFQKPWHSNAVSRNRDIPSRLPETLSVNHNGYKWCYLFGSEKDNSWFMVSGTSEENLRKTWCFVGNKLPTKPAPRKTLETVSWQRSFLFGCFEL